MHEEGVEPLTRRKLFKANGEVEKRLLDNAGEDAGRWALAAGRMVELRSGLARSRGEGVGASLRPPCAMRPIASTCGTAFAA